AFDPPLTMIDTTESSPLQTALAISRWATERWLERSPGCRREANEPPTPVAGVLSGCRCGGSIPSGHAPAPSSTIPQSRECERRRGDVGAAGTPVESDRWQAAARRSETRLPEGPVVNEDSGPRRRTERGRRRNVGCDG